MVLFNIAFKNIKRNFSTYFIYFMSMVFSIMIFYTFTSLQYNQQVLSLSKFTSFIGPIFLVTSIIVATFSAIFIWYSNSFFTRKRKKEVALYSMFGIKKQQIGRLLFYENIIMGILALAAGVLAGSILSKLFIMILVKLMGYSVYIKFVIIPKAIVHTIIVFAILFLITSIHGYTLIYRFKLIELFKAGKVSDKEPKTSASIAIISILLIGLAYYIALTLVFKIDILIYTLSTILLSIIGSFGFFHASTIFIIKLAKKNKKRYYKGINMIGTSQLLYRIKGHARTLALIAILSATTLTAIGTTYSLSYDLTKNIDKKVKEIIAKYPKNKLLHSIEYDLLRFQGKFVNPNSPSSDSKNRYYIIGESKINEILNMLKIKEEIVLNNPNEVIVIDQLITSILNEDYTKMTAEVIYNNGQESFQVVDHKVFRFTNSFLPDYILVVQDDVFKRLYQYGTIRSVKGYSIANQKNSESSTEELEKVVPEDAELIPYYTNYRNAYDMRGLFIFIGSFLGLVFLVATGSIIYFKQLTEANTEKERYKILKNIGVNNKEIRTSIARQILFVFALPLLLGILHSSVALTALSKIMNSNLIIPVASTIGSYTLIYLVYYVLTVNSYSKIVNSNE
ncbi:MAG: FtsX-like permease family protein [Halanaerobiales bacterium]|nr:FtsX-like permease family protein [Halanaerobiales bacterium]